MLQILKEKVQVEARYKYLKFKFVFTNFVKHLTKYLKLFIFYYIYIFKYLKNIYKCEFRYDIQLGKFADNLLSYIQIVNLLFQF